MNVEYDEVLRQVQQDILEGGAGEGYARAYRAAERNYWIHVPGWIASLPRGIRVIDIGCAYGTLSLFTKRLLDAKVTCVDAISAYSPQRLFAAEGVPFLLRNIELDDFSDLGQFDLVIITEVLEHLNFHPRETLKKIRSLLCPDGRLILTTPDSSEWGVVTKYYSSLSEMPDPIPGRDWEDAHIWQYSESELRSVLEEAGFRIAELAYSPGNKSRHFNVLCTRKWILEAPGLLLALGHQPIASRVEDRDKPEVSV